MSSMFISPNDVTSSTDSPSESGHVSLRASPTSKGPTRSGLGKDDDNENGTKVESGVQRSSSSVAVSPLPKNLNPDQHQSMFQLAMLEQSCIMQAAKTLNEGRGGQDKLSEDSEEVMTLAEKLYTEMSSLFQNSARLPGELVDAVTGKGARESYRTNFGAVLGNAAAKVVKGLDAFSNSSDDNSPSAGPSARLRRRGSRALAPIGMDRTLDGNISSSAPSIMFGQSDNPFTTKSRYQSEYEELATLGKGGYGQVFKVRNHLDNQEYAIKKIAITSKKLHASRENEQIEALLAELRTLARLFHTNIVRYHHGWIESSSATPASAPAKSQAKNLLPAPLSDYESATQTYESDDVITQDEWNRGMDFDMDPSMQLRFERAYDKHDFDDGIIFGEPSLSQSRGFDVHNRGSSLAMPSSKILHKLSAKGRVEEDDDVETIPRPASLPKKGTSPTQQPDSRYDGPDIVLCIQMSLHPTTLSSFLSPDPPKEGEYGGLRHCYHQGTSVAILKAILDGMDYLHSQNIVHRDLKPANIFLSVQEDRSPSLSGSININECPDCHKGKDTKCLFITPCIGDFGLIAEINTTNDIYEPAPLAQFSPRPVGTQFYRPSRMPATEPKICPKLDVYSLGIIAFELIYKFGTKTERAMLLTELSRGVLPTGFKHPMAHGILRMVCQDRDQRWDCPAVRKWLDEM